MQGHIGSRTCEGVTCGELQLSVLDVVGVVDCSLWVDRSFLHVVGKATFMMT